ncbi:hypothetical protein HH_0526 [Helicobacter hepaticus ATCC 51449]|uniref:Uncharacterized protein n=1 Tax=Helicobacter hepaticus (strain ATCC 51449 / 3B1) TaxID=235279 RepID=Q7VIS8_HELHP|nr:hypothetical protein HH_0526 [Helicobacter hepaticus ATCC 51449]
MFFPAFYQRSGEAILNFITLKKSKYATMCPF